MFTLVYVVPLKRKNKLTVIYVKVKITPRHIYAGTDRRQMYSCKPFTTWTLEEGG
jgi:hypothetical protein